MAALVVFFAGPLADWLALDTWHRALRLAALILAAIGVYFGVLFALGLRYRHLSRAGA
jgi:peptidoglycan biosynthesis protein MviN/MurJ (putative lipid II flippase)